MEFDPWTQSLLSAMSSLWGSVAAFIPRLFGALVVVLLGFVVAKLLDTLLSKVLGKIGLDRLMAGTGLTKLLGRAGIRVPVSTLVGKIVYWFVLLIFLVSAAESLGLERVSATLDVLALYVPKVLGAALILLVGMLLAQLVSGLVRGAAEGVGLDYAHGLARIAQGLVIIIGISVAIGQLEVKTELLNYVIAIVLITVGLAVALALGLGSRELVGQILAGIYVRELYEVGQRIRLAELEGEIEEIGTVKTLVLLDDGELASIPNRTLLEQRVGSRSLVEYVAIFLHPIGDPGGLPARSVLTKTHTTATRYNPRELTDEELVERARVELFHITRAYEELMRRYQRTLFNVCARYLGNDRDADDVCQEVMLKVLYGLKTFEGKSKFKTWLYSITYNECITQYRKERRKRRLLDALSLDPIEEASEEKAPKLEEKGGLDRWLVHVNPIDREILVLRFVAELEFQEIADIMPMGLSATKMRYKRALDKLRQNFSDSPET